MTIEVTPDGTVLAYRNRERNIPYDRLDRAAWERLTVASYSNDAGCPACPRARGVGNLIRDTAYVEHHGLSKFYNGSQVVCNRCKLHIVRFRLHNKNHYFGYQVPTV